MKFPCRHGATAWLGVAITSMAFMGAYAFLIVLSRAPGFNMLFTEQDFFKTALVTHVVLAVVIWFLAFAIFLMYYVTADRQTPRHELFAAGGALMGVLFIVATPFSGPAFPQLNNYVPVLNAPLYFTGLLVFFVSAILGFVFRAPAVYEATVKSKAVEASEGGALLLAGFALVVAVTCFALAAVELNSTPGMDVSRLFFESLFWGGGHVLQFANTAGMMAAWAILGRSLSGGAVVKEKAAWLVFAAMALFIVAGPLYYAKAPVVSTEHRTFFLLLKGWGLSFGPVVFGYAVASRWSAIGGKGSASLGLLASITLFALGGFISLTIEGSDTRIPAHYHGVIGAVTLAFMTMGLSAMTENGRLAVSEKWKKFQLGLYGVGQAMFVIGLFIGGTRGLPRKTFGQAQELDDAMKVLGMGVMGIGGALAITSGAIFVVFMIKALAKRTDA
ncbi:MAG: cbb3-type cytochrome c oxidase subunit I [Nitrospinae bacterium]|nr:cbb3-type cytochrome c oxidase subunit I [Nitrospinota bacterium]